MRRTFLSKLACGLGFHDYEDRLLFGLDGHKQIYKKCKKCGGKFYNIFPKKFNDEVVNKI